MVCFERAISWALLQNSSRFFRLSRFESLQCSTTLIRVKNISQINCLDRRVSVAPMMDWSDGLMFGNRRKQLHVPKIACPHSVSTPHNNFDAVADCDPPLSTRSRKLVGSLDARECSAE